MQYNLRQLLDQPLSLRSLWDICKTAMENAHESQNPLPYFLIESIAGIIADNIEGNPESADFADIRDSLLRPMIVKLLDDSVQKNDSQFVAAANEAIKGCLISL